MIKIFKRKPQETEQAKRPNIFGRLKQGLNKTRLQLTEGISTVALGKKTLDENLFEEIETRLLMADVGVDATQTFIADLTNKLKRKQLDDADTVIASLKTDMANLLATVSEPLTISNHKPFVLLMIGVNGSGKTTTIGKLAKRFQEQGKTVMLAAGDTFRAAAIDQLKIWGERNEIPVIAQQPGSDSASVIYDAYQSAKARKIDILIADTAGRLHTQDNLMEELKKIVRVIKKMDESAPHEIMLVLDANIGQNALHQAKEFHRAVNISGLAITKLDGTAKGGIIFAIAKSLKLPIRFIGFGEQIDDLQPFDANEFVDALFAE